MRYKVNDSKIFCDISDNIAILIEFDAGIYYGLNCLTTNIFENIINGVEIDELLNELRKIKTFSKENEKKFNSFLSSLIDKEFIVESDKEIKPLNLTINEFANDESDFVIADYPDAAELLLADPIHQVKEDKGWKPSIDSLKNND